MLCGGQYFGRDREIDQECGCAAYPVEQRNSALAFCLVLCHDYDYEPCGLLVDLDVVVDSPGASEALR